MITKNSLGTKYAHHIIALIAAILLTQNVFSQNIQVAPLNHSLKVYRDLDTNTLFWPKELPVYVWLSTSDEPTAPMHRLDDASITTEEGSNEIEQSYIDLELSGNQYIRWVNYDTKDTLMLQFQADGIAPISNILLAGAEEQETGSTQFFGKNLNATFVGEDEHSGIEHIYVSVNGAEFSPYFNTFEFNQEKEYTVAWYAVDNVGNPEDVRSSNFSVDLNPPSTRHQINGIHQGSVLSTSATITLLSEDALSGLNEVSYRFDNNTEETVSVGEISVSTLAEGSHFLYYRASDNVGNVEEVNEFSFYLDRTSPITELQVNGDQYVGDRFYVSDRTTYRLSSSDNKTGVKSTHYQISGNAEVEYNAGTFRLPSESQVYTLSYWSQDNVSNEEQQNDQQLVLDLQAPVSEHSFSDVAFTQRGITWIPSSTTLNFSSNDDLSGVKFISYSIDNDIQEATFTSNLEFQNEGRYTIQYWATDRVNNVESYKSIALVVDNTAPSIITNFSTSKIGSSAAEDGSILDEYSRGTLLFMAATDESSGTDQMWYSINNSEEIPFSGPITFSELGEQEIIIRCVDRIGNEISETMRLIIGD
jgi:hypothetical protein